VAFVTKTGTSRLKAVKLDFAKSLLNQFDPKFYCIMEFGNLIFNFQFKHCHMYLSQRLKHLDTSNFEMKIPNI